MYTVYATEVSKPTDILEEVEVPQDGPLETYLTDLSFGHTYRIIVVARNTFIKAASPPVDDIFEFSHRGQL